VTPWSPWSPLPGPRGPAAAEERLTTLVTVLVTAAGLAAATFATLALDGTKSVGPQVYYFPVVLAGYRFRWLGGVATGIAAGLACGPWMPLDLAEGTPQSTAAWVTRLAIFAAVGAAVGVLADLSRRRAADLERFGSQVSRAFVRAIDAGHPYTAHHSETVAELAVATGTRLGLSATDLERLRWAALLHDIGKLALPSTVLDKPLELTSLEWELVKRHPVESARIIGDVDRFQDQLDGVRHHHERFDGTGYPDGLAGEEIPLDARIIAVADAFDAMTTNRSYRLPLEREQALRRIAQGAGTQFDPVVVEAFAAVVRELPHAVEPTGAEAPADALRAGESAA
jgi:putative nucleotidyltransferase with HDIG domain